MVYIMLLCPSQSKTVPAFAMPSSSSQVQATPIESLENPIYGTVNVTVETSFSYAVES